MDYTTIQDAVLDQVDDSSAAMRVRAKRYINWCQQDVASRQKWEFKKTKGRVQVTASYSTGTVSVTNASATVTGSGTTFTTAMTGRKITIATDSGYYTITFVSTTEVTLDKAYTGTTGSGKTYVIWEDEYSLATDLLAGEDLLDIYTPEIVTLYPEPIQRLNNRTPASYSSGNLYYTLSGLDSSKYQKIRFSHYFGTTLYTFNYTYYKTLTDLSATTDASLIPSKYHKILYLGAVAQVFEFLKDDRSNNYWAQYENMIKDMERDLAFDPATKTGQEKND